MDLEKLKKLCEAATPGPWKPDVWIETDGNGWRATGPHHEDEASDEGSEPGCPDEQAAQHDAAFIAAARTALPELIAEVERLRSVYEAACAWRDVDDGDDDEIPRANSLVEAIDRARGGAK